MESAYVVLGAYGGIGSALSRRLASRGHQLLLAGRDEVRLAGLAAELGAQTYVLDAINVRHVEACFKHASQLFGGLTGVANCVGSLLLKPAHLLSEDDWDATLNINLKSAYATGVGYLEMTGYARGSRP